MMASGREKPKSCPSASRIPYSEILAILGLQPPPAFPIAAPTVAASTTTTTTITVAAAAVAAATTAVCAPSSFAAAETFAALEMLGHRGPADLEALLIDVLTSDEEILAEIDVGGDEDPAAVAGQDPEPVFSQRDLEKAYLSEYSGSTAASTMWSAPHFHALQKSRPSSYLGRSLTNVNGLFPGSNFLAYDDVFAIAAKTAKTAEKISERVSKKRGLVVHQGQGEEAENPVTANPAPSHGAHDDLDRTSGTRGKYLNHEEMLSFYHEIVRADRSLAPALAAFTCRGCNKAIFISPRIWRSDGWVSWARTVCNCAAQLHHHEMAPAAYKDFLGPLARHLTANELKAIGFRYAEQRRQLSEKKKS